MKTSKLETEENSLTYQSYLLKKEKEKNVQKAFLMSLRETRGRSLGREDPLKKEMATHSSIHAWRIPWTEEPGRLQPMRSQRVGHDWATSFSLSLASPALAGEFILSTTTWKAQGMWDLSSLTRD